MGAVINLNDYRVRLVETRCVCNVCSTTWIQVYQANKVPEPKCPACSEQILIETYGNNKSTT